MEENIAFEREVLEYLNLPSLPLKKWNGKDGFRNSVAVVETYSGCRAYAVASFDPSTDKGVRIVKAFSQEVFYKVNNVLIVPEYMDTDVAGFDLDEDSKKRAEDLVKEAEELENENVMPDVPNIDELPEWIFDVIHNREEANAWLKSYNKRNRIKGSIPKSDENVKLRLYAIYTEMKKKQK